MGRPNENYVAPTTLDAALEMIWALRKTVETMHEEMLDLQGELDDYDCENCRDLEDSLEDAEDRNSALDERVTELVKIRHAIKLGTVNDDHIYQLEKLLSELDSGWMCRA